MDRRRRGACVPHRADRRAVDPAGVERRHARAAVNGGRTGRRGRATGRGPHPASPNPPPPSRRRCRPESQPPPLPQPIERPLPSPRPEPSAALAAQAPAAAPRRAPGNRPAPLAPRPAQPPSAARVSATISSRASTTTFAPRRPVAARCADVRCARRTPASPARSSGRLERCADRQPLLGEGAESAERQARPCSFCPIGPASSGRQWIGVDRANADLRAKYGELARRSGDRRSIAECSPFRLPAELYDTASGGWKEHHESFTG